MSSVTGAVSLSTAKISVLDYDRIHIPQTSPPLYIVVDYVEIEYVRSARTDGAWEVKEVKVTGVMVREDGSQIGSHPTDFHFDNHELLNTWVADLAFRFSPTETGPRCVSG
jgi:hypothetical protein